MHPQAHVEQSSAARAHADDALCLPSWRVGRGTWWLLAGSKLAGRRLRC
jgi:hypothetical protein